MDNGELQKWMQWNGEYMENLHGSLFSVTPETLKNKFDHLRSTYVQEHHVRFPKASENLGKKEVSDVLGIYKMVGHNPDNRKALYKGNLTLYWEAPSIRAIWEIGPKQYQFGRGFFHGNNLYLAFFYTDEDREFDGQVIYEFVSENRLIGFWVEEGSFIPGYEELMKVENK